MVDLSTIFDDFKGDLVTPTDPQYPAAIARWAVNAQRKAAVVAFVKDEQDVALAINYARRHGLPIAIRGGGHHPAGASSSEGGLVIDLSRYLNGVKVDDKKNLAYVGGGALWEAVDREAIKYGLATVGGTVNHTGVGGLLLGGGYGWLSGAQGLVIDNLVQATIVTADGSVLTASSTENPDLFFGIRGGGCNFGVATEFVLQLHAQRATVYAGVLIYSPVHLEAIVNATAAWLPTAGKDEAMLQMTVVGPEGQPCIVIYPFFNGTEAEGRANFKVFLDIGPAMDKTGDVPYEAVNALQNPMVSHGTGKYMKGIAHKEPHYPSIAKAFEKVVELSKPDDFSATIIYEYFPLAKIGSVANGSTAFRRDPTPSVLFVLSWQQDSAGMSDRARAAARDLAAILVGGQSELKNSESLGYSNYDPEAVTGEKESVPDKAKLVFRENYPKLQQIKKKYDPENIFSKWFPITPA